MRNLRLYSRAAEGTPVFARDISNDATGWRRSIRRDGGYWQGSFKLTGDFSDLHTFFYQYLGGHLEEKSNGFVTWEGLLYEMELSVGGVTRRRSLDLLYNKVTTRYINEDNENITGTPASNATSIAKYSTREELLLLDGYTETAANTRRDTFLNEHCYPWARAVGAGLGGGEATLNVVAAGYALTTNWQYAGTAVADGGTVNLSDYMGTIVAAHCPLVYTGGIAANTLQVVKTTNVPARAWDLMMDLVDLGGTVGAPYRAYVGNGRRFYYEQIGTAPEYYLRNGGLYGSPGGRVEADPWAVQPAVVRDMSWPVSAYDKGSWLLDGRDFYIEEVEVSDPGVLVLKTDLFEESEILAAQQAYQIQLEQESGGGMGAAGSGRGSLNWKRAAGIPEDQWSKLTNADKWQYKGIGKRRKALKKMKR
jgi:hypothetical protein